MDHLFFTLGQRREWGEQFNRQFPAKATEAIAEADRWCAGNRLVWKNMNIDLGDPIDWLHNPTGDKEFTWGINRFKHLRSLGIAYACTGNEKYAARALAHITGWIDTQPCPRNVPAEELTYFQRPGPWRLLETGLRLRQWVYAYHFFHGSASWTGDQEQRFFDSVKEHAWFLSTYTASIEINHSIMHMIGLLSAGLTFISWEESPEWRNKAIERLEDCIRVQVLSDGVHSELTPHYHMVSLELFVDCAVMLQKRGLAFSDEYERIVAGMVRFATCMTRQDGSMAPFADSYATHPPDLNAAALYMNQPEFMLAEQLHEQFWTVGPLAIKQLLDARGEGKLPAAKLPFAFPKAGYYGLGSSEQKLIFDAAALGGPHGHADALSFEFCAFGEALFVDPGTYTYMENPWRRYFKSTSAHNTVLVDGQDQTPYLRTQSWGLPEANVTLLTWEPDQQMICAEHDGYEGRGIKHRRAVWFLESGEWVIYDRLTGTGQHTFQHRLHSRLLDWKVEKLAGAESAPYYAIGSRLMGEDSPITCEMLVFGPESMSMDVEDSWESVLPMTMQPLKVLQSLINSSEGTWFITVMRPSQGSGELQPAEWSIQLDEWKPPVLSLNRADRHTRFVMPE
ncbi:heparinase II/III family protein [Paenibacillus sp. 2TAB23]|uniref:heparinase II/III family protein n=1 Tax=Paenibacillus sp. 2TAB23 TaxID=3233004 RepID=UPI003F97DB49